ncbi:MAG: hypothetical protein IKX37_02755, partial [Bacteroidales bacterium]|nr:hypothetical protein [Bacteroidales bacterium]
YFLGQGVTTGPRNGTIVTKMPYYRHQPAKLWDDGDEKPILFHIFVSYKIMVQPFLGELYWKYGFGTD